MVGNGFGAKVKRGLPVEAHEASGLIIQTPRRLNNDDGSDSDGDDVRNYSPRVTSVACSVLLRGSTPPIQP